MANLISNISNVGFKTSEGGEIFNDYKGNIASSENSHAEGQGTKASSKCQHVQGQYNIEDSSNTYADIIGNGSSDTERSNASTVDWQGNAWYAGDVYVGSTSGKNKDDGSKKLATEEYTNNIINKKIEVSETAPTEEENKIWLQPITTNAGAVDYIVEQGISGIWTYRKWNSGIAECWGRSSISGISTTSGRETYYYNSEVTVNYPSGLFSSEPVPNIILSPSAGFAFPSDTTTSGSKDFAQFFIVTPNEGVSDLTVYYSIHAIGRWK